jgi:predicted transcriptional regulator
MSDEHESGLPASLRAFLHTCIESIDQVELLLMLRGSDRWRTARDIAAEVGVPIAVARRSVETLAARGLLEVRVGAVEEIGYRYRPKSDDLARYCDLLAQYYITSRHAVLGYVATESRLSMKRFADAFRLRDPEEP